MRTTCLPAALLTAVVWFGCSSNSTGPDATGRRDTGPTYDVDPDELVTYTEQREPCAERNKLRNLYWGDLHVHTDLSFDAYAWGVRNSPRQAYEFAKGQRVRLPPRDENGRGTRTAQLERPLDFVALTDHAEYFGEVDLCDDPQSPVYDEKRCRAIREPGSSLYINFSLDMVKSDPKRYAPICGPENERCLGRARSVWERVQQAADAAYDRSSECSFTSLVGYEYTNIRSGNNMHRNVIFRNQDVPDEAFSVFEEHRPRDLWERLEAECLEADGNCDVLAIPHNSNLSGGEMFHPTSIEADSPEATEALAATRSELEPLMEIYQHKGSMECGTGVSGLLGQPDELCNFEKIYNEPFRDCGDDIGKNAIMGFGCVSRYNFFRDALAVGLKAKQDLGVNPMKLGVIASTDTHNGTPGEVQEADWPGHFGVADADPNTRLDTYNSLALTSKGVYKSAGGLAAVWAVENSRDAIFEALQRRETYGTSGPRMAVRLFGGWDYAEGLCGDPNLVETGYARGVPMGGDLPAPPADDEDAAPHFIVQAQKDPGTEQNPGVDLQHIQIVKGWVGEDGEKQLKVFDVAGDPDSGASVDTSTCETSGDGFGQLCTVWQDPEFDRDQHAFYYARVLQNPTCRWHTRLCNSLPENRRNPQCDNDDVQQTIQERAWTSPIWFTPR